VKKCAVFIFGVFLAVLNVLPISAADIPSDDIIPPALIISSIEEEWAKTALNAQRRQIIETAKQYLGIPYKTAGSTPNGFDCSGFVWYVYRTAIKMDVPRSSRGVWASNAETFALKDAKPGDIVVFSANKGGGSINHTAILLDGDTMIHAVSDGPRRGILISPLNDKYFAPRIVGVKSFIKESE
jgi:cell wall-associated NlpC family hydrolase